MHRGQPAADRSPWRRGGPVDPVVSGSRAGWWRRRLLAEGTEPDPRFSFANERTYLAWIRTALALVAGGVGVDAFAEDLPDWSRTVLAVVLVVLGACVAATSFTRWRRAELALRRREPLPLHSLLPVLGYGLAVAAVGVGVLVVVAG